MEKTGLLDKMNLYMTLYGLTWLFKAVVLYLLSSGIAVLKTVFIAHRIEFPSFIEFLFYLSDFLLQNGLEFLWVSFCGLCLITTVFLHNRGIFHKEYFHKGLLLYNLLFQTLVLTLLFLQFRSFIAIIELLLAAI
jgi:hypothetical protein